MRADLRAEAAFSFLWRLFVMLAMVLGGVWALLTYFEPCAAATLYSAVPLIRQPYTGRGPLWWQRLVLRARLLSLGGRQRQAAEQERHCKRSLAVRRVLLDNAESEEEAEALRAEIELLSDLREGYQSDKEDADERIAWARSDLAKLT